MPGPKSGYRARLFKALHAEASKRKLDHDALHDLFVTRCKVHSMSEVPDHELERVYREWTGKSLRRRAQLPKRGEAQADVPVMITGEELTVLSAEFAKRHMSTKEQQTFVRRQLRGRDVIRTRRDYAKVFGGLRAMNRRDNIV